MNLDPKTESAKTMNTIHTILLTIFLFRFQNNGSIYIHVYVTRYGMSPNPADLESYAGEEMSHSSRLLNKFKKIRKTTQYSFS